MLSLLETKIRKDIPRLMEFREGCIIQNNYNGDLEIFLGYISIDGFSRVVLKDLYIKSIRIDIEGNLIIDEFDKYAYSIIGHDIMLNDVLEWLFDLKVESTIYVRYDKNKHGKPILEISYTSLAKRTNGEYSNIFISSCWKLSSPYLKDQSEELIKFLYNLIKE